MSGEEKEAKEEGGDGESMKLLLLIYSKDTKLKQEPNVIGEVENTEKEVRGETEQTRKKKKRQIDLLNE